MADDLNTLTNFQVLNGDLVVCNMNSSVKLTSILIGKGRGYVPKKENKILDSEFGVIPIDAIFTPIKM